MLAPRILPFVALLAVAAPSAAQEVVPLPHFDGVELRGGGEVKLTYGPVQKVTIQSGSSEFTRIRVIDRPTGRLVIDACNERCPRHYDLKIEIQTPDIDAVSVHGGGAITASAGFPRQKNVAVAVHGGGIVDLRSVAVGDVAAAVHGGGKLMIRADGNLAASVNGGGLINYWGDPRVVTSINGGGIVSPGR